MKELKKNVNHMAWGLVIYTILCVIVSIIGVFVKLFKEQPGWLNLTDAEFDAVFSSIEQQGFYGLLSCVMVIIGVAVLFLYFRKRIDTKQMFSSNKSMKANDFFQILCVFMGVQLLVEPIFWLMEKCFNLFGYSVATSLEDASMVSENLFMFLYAVIMAPIAEELIYRGFVLSSIEKYGKIFAIITSAILFGVMHTNIPQSVFAALVGIVLGYVAIEYSIWWAILLHVINNGFSDLMYALLKNYSEGVQNVVCYIVFGCFFVPGVIVLWKKRKKICEYISENKPQKITFLYAFTTVGMLVFMIMETLTAFDAVEKLG